jgi:hypothetical protein
MLAPGALARTNQDHSDEHNVQLGPEAIRMAAAYQDC